MTRLSLALAGLLVLAGCSTTPPPKLQPIPQPAAVVVRVPTYVSLPPDATTPCAKPQARPIATDVDLLKAAMAWRTTAECNQNKLAAIRAAQPKDTAP